MSQSGSIILIGDPMGDCAGGVMCMNQISPTHCHRECSQLVCLNQNSYFHRVCSGD